jgi:glycyl-tRNA synthetase
VDHDTIETQTVTIRYRDSMKQERIAIKDIKGIIEQQVSFKNWMFS